MNEDVSSGEGRPVNKTTGVNMENAGYTIVASVRMHSDGGEALTTEDKCTVLAVNPDTGAMVCWDTFNVNQYKELGGFGGGYYSNFPLIADNSAIDAFRMRIENETEKAITRAFTRAKGEK